MILIKQPGEQGVGLNDKTTQAHKTWICHDPASKLEKIKDMRA